MAPDPSTPTPHSRWIHRNPNNMQGAWKTSILHCGLRKTRKMMPARMDTLPVWTRDLPGAPPNLTLGRAGELGTQFGTSDGCGRRASASDGQSSCPATMFSLAPYGSSRTSCSFLVAQGNDFVSRTSWSLALSWLRPCCSRSSHLCPEGDRSPS